MLGEGISSAVLVTGLIVDLVVVVCEEFQPSHLSAVQYPWLCKGLKVLVIGEYMDQ